MEKENTRTRRRHLLPATVPRSPASSPCLIRSKSGITSPEIRTFSTDPSPMLVGRSKSTTKLRNPYEKSQEKFNNTRTARSACTSPSAWALSSARPLPSSPAPAPTVPKSPSSRKLKLDSGGGGGGGVAGVLKYFKQKKVSPVLEDDFHQLRIMNNRLVQWRFVNARVEASMAAMKRIAQKRLFNVWLRISIMRNFAAEKKIQLQKMKHDVKLNRIINSQGCLLREWARLEVKNCEAVGRVARKLSAISTCLPLVDGAEADVMLVFDAITSTEEAMDGIEDLIMNMQWQVEQSCYLLTELIVILKQEQEYLEELESNITSLTSLEVGEESLTVYDIQLANESRREFACY